MSDRHSEFHTDTSQNGTQFRLTFITNDKNQFLAMQNLARKCIDKEDVLSLENRILVLEHDKEIRDMRDKITNLFANMQYGKCLSDKERVAYYKLKLNEIWGAENYQDTDSVSQSKTNEEVN